MTKIKDEVLTQLGNAAPLPTSPEQATLERISNPQNGQTYLIRFTCPEFTSLCPITGQPDFAHLIIDYAPLIGSSKASPLNYIWAHIGTTVPFTRIVPLG